MQHPNMDWFTDARFGMFIHWGLYAIPARGEWIMKVENIHVDEYRKYFDQFNPNAYDPTAWAKAAKQAGMKYVILTAKHHDGFCLFDSKLTDYKSTNTALGRDIVADFVEAVRNEGLRVGLYYSLLDWHHPDYPKYNDENHPMQGMEEFRDEEINFDNYLDYMHGQVQELMTNYGTIDMLWFDFSYADMRREKWRAKELVEMIRLYQPDIIMNNRLDVNEPCGSKPPSLDGAYSGDYISPEQALPVQGIRDAEGKPLPWELCSTMNNAWGYRAQDTCYKSAKLLVHKLVECVSKGGNMLLNVGPDANGRIPAQSTDILAEIGRWMDANGESIYGCGETVLPRPEWGRYTGKPGIVYAHIFEETIGPLPLQGLEKGEIKSVSLLRDGAEVCAADRALIARGGTTMPYYTLSDNDPNYTVPLPDPADTVLKVELNQ